MAVLSQFSAATCLVGRVQSVSNTPRPTRHCVLRVLIVDGMFYTRGPSSDFDRFAKATGDSGWSWSNIQKYLKKVCNVFILTLCVIIKLFLRLGSARKVRSTGRQP